MSLSTIVARVAGAGVGAGRRCGAGQELTTWDRSQAFTILTQSLRQLNDFSELSVYNEAKLHFKQGTGPLDHLQANRSLKPAGGVANDDAKMRSDGPEPC